jgi:hypothetical protein
MVNGFQVQYRSTPTSLWKPLRFGNHTFNTLAEAIERAESLDQDFCFSFKDKVLRIVNMATGKRVTGE